MSGMRVPPVAQQPDQEQEFVFGPYAAADVAAANTYVRLPFLSQKSKIIESVGVRATVKSAAAINMALAKTADGAAAPSGALSATAAGRITENVALDGLTNLTLSNVSIHPTSSLNTLNNNLVEAGSALWAYFTDTPTSLAGLYIVVRMRETY